MANDLYVASNQPWYNDGTPGIGRQGLVYGPSPTTLLAERHPQIPFNERRFVGDKQHPDLEGFQQVQSEYIPGQGTRYLYRDPYGYPTSTVFKKPDPNPGIIDSFLTWLSRGAWEADPYWYDPRFMREPFKGSEGEFMLRYGYSPNQQITQRDMNTIN